jgi:hypothetical protein
MTALRALLPPENQPLSVSPAHQSPLAHSSAIEHRLFHLLKSAPRTLTELEVEAGGDKLAWWRTIVEMRQRGVIQTADLTRQASPPPHALGPVAPRTVAEIEALGLAGHGPEVRPIPTLPEIRSGAPAEENEIAAVTDVLREVVAGFNAGASLQAYAHYTDDHFRRGGPIPDDELEMLRRPAAPLPPEEWESLEQIKGVRLLADGRLTAIAKFNRPAAGEVVKVVVFARSNGRWQIDAVIETGSHPKGFTSILRPIGHTALLAGV